MQTNNEFYSNVKFLCSLKENTFNAIFQDCDNNEWAGSTYNGKYYSEHEIYIAYRKRDSYSEVLI